MRILSLLAILAFTLLVFQYCSSTKKVQSPAVSFDNNVHPIITNSCSPCHTTGGKQKTLDTYAAASGEIDEIISRISKMPNEKGFMPFKHAKLPDSTITVFVRWKEAGMPAK